MEQTAKGSRVQDSDWHAISVCVCVLNHVYDPRVSVTTCLVMPPQTLLTELWEMSQLDLTLCQHSSQTLY